MSRTEYAVQRQRHGAAKNFAERVGGVIVGAALVVLASQWLKRRQQGALATHRTDAETALAGQAAPETDTPATHPSGS